MKKPVRCISGESAATEFLMQFFDTAAQVYPYKMMHWKGSCKASTPLSNLSAGEEIIRCTEHDMEILHPLQKDYMKEEVAVPGRKLTDAEVDISLRQILKNQLCLALTFDGEIVAKANTNAIGINCVQIGGVYSHPLYRRNGYAAALVQALCNRALRSHKQPVLFVKEKNMPAFNLYRKLGFEECGQYTIAYY
ncbi:MAG: GNAT family N-acetyltransferase [Treponema sp.]|nr:GNAT family N-acetyltransferase [Treponema sp.]